MAQGAIPAPGQTVEVRGRHYVVQDVLPAALPPDALRSLREGAGHTLVKLSSIEDDGLGEQLQVMWELEPGRQIIERLTLPDPDGFDSPRELDAFINAVRWGAISSADARSLQAPFRSGIEIESYQLAPLVRALRMPRANLLIADDVGLGKTIESGLVVQEFILRHRVHTVLIVCPASLQVQWRDQMRNKFGLEFRIVDTELMRELRRSRGLQVNPWKHYPRLITSIDYLKRERPLRLFREILPPEGKPAFPRSFDLLIVDEAHNVAPSRQGRYSKDSLRTLAIRTLVPHFEHKLFLSATPHNGYKESWSALLELLDNQRFARTVEPDRKQLEVVMVRRMKNELCRAWDGTPPFAQREIRYVEVDWPEEELQAHAKLQRYTELRLRNTESQEERFASEFVLRLLKKRLFSSPAAFLSTLQLHIGSLKTSRRRAGVTARPRMSVLRTQIEAVEEDYSSDEELEEATDEALATAQTLFRPLSPEEETLLKELHQWAERATERPDAKARELIRWIRTHIRPEGGTWTGNRVLIFTEYRTTQKWLAQQLALEGLAEDEALMQLYGGMKSEDRERIKAAFQADPEISPVRILLATDAASEGIDLQNYCHNLFHYEIPWSPIRMEQRNGRLDRHGQKAPFVYVHHFVGTGFDRHADVPQTPPGRLAGDLEFLARMAWKVEQIREDLGKVGPVIARQVQEAMVGARRSLDTSAAEREAEPVRRTLKFERDLKAEVERLRERLDRSRQDLHITPETVQSVVEVALALAGQPPLIPAEVEGLWPDPSGLRKQCPVFHVPDLTHSWASCTEGLDDPFTGKRRPIVFDQTLAGRRDVVLAHLNHRLVQMSLRLLRAEVWSSGPSRRLHRMTARVTSNDVLQTPAVIIYGRIVVLGGDHHRLHEEIIQAGGLLKEGRFSRLTAQRDLDAALRSATDCPVPDSMQEKLQAMWPAVRQPLMRSLEARMHERTENLQKFLDDRAEKDIADITAILKELQRTIRQELDSALEPQQLVLAFPDQEEREQIQRDYDSLRARLNAIPAELENEVQAIRNRYAAPEARLFPVAVTWLVPEKLVRGREGRQCRPPFG